MEARLRTKLGLGCVLGLAVAAGWAYFAAGPGPKRGGRPTPLVVTDATPLPALTRALRESDARALAAVLKKLTPAGDAAPAAWTEAEAAEWVEVIKGIRAGFLGFGSYGRSSALTVLGRTFQRFGVEPTAAPWIEALPPAHGLLTAGLADDQLDVRVTALMEVSRLWSWLPGRTLVSTQEEVLASWKDGFHAPVVRKLSDPEPRARAAAVSCLGKHPIDRAARPALAYLEDPKSPEVRQQVLVSFATRPTLLSEDAVLRHMYDREGAIAETAELVLKTRGLSQEQISLGSMIFHPKPEIRASVIPLLKERNDVDPVVWLIQLTHDTEESVRLGALDALHARRSPEVVQRLIEMAAQDASPAVRAAAGKQLPASEKTAALPALPGSMRLNPKAN